MSLLISLSHEGEWIVRNACIMGIESMSCHKKSVLEVEISVYEKSKEELLKQDEGKYVVIKGESILDVYDDEPRAIQAGYEEYGNVPFLVKRIALFDTPANFVSNTLGITSANLQCSDH